MRKKSGEPVGNIIIKSSSLKSITCPKTLVPSAIDEFPLLFIVASLVKGVSKFDGIGELRHKESDRIKSIELGLNQLGIKTQSTIDTLKIYGNPNLALKGKYNIKNFKKDHRVFMMSCIAALSFGGNWIINNPESVNTSFPEYHPREVL